MSYRVTFNKRLPPDGRVDVVFSFRTAHGGRVEVCGQFSRQLADDILRQIAEAAANKPTTETPQ